MWEDSSRFRHHVCRSVFKKRTRSVFVAGLKVKHPGLFRCVQERQKDQDLKGGILASTSSSKDMHQQLENVLASIDKRYGAGSVIRLSQSSVGIQGDVIDTGSIGLNSALGIGGYPKGRIVEIYGPESSGKTTLALQAVAAVQLSGGVAAFVDAEHAMDGSYAERLGVVPERLIVSQPDTGEQALDIVERLSGTGMVDLVVVDSVAALVPQAEIEGEMGDQQVGLQARMMSKAMRKLTSAVARTGCTLMFINQLRQKVGVRFGSNEVTTGGHALKYYSSLRLDVRRIGSVKSGEDFVGNRVRVRVVKNKMASPFRKAEFDIRFGEGVCLASELLDYGQQYGLIQRSGSWFSFGDVRLGQGRDRTRNFLLEHPAEFEELKAAVLLVLTKDGNADELES